MPRDSADVNRWANRALENLYGGWLALTEHQLMLIIEATGGLDPDTADAREALRVRLGDVSWSAVYAALNTEARRASSSEAELGAT